MIQIEVKPVSRIRPTGLRHTPDLDHRDGRNAVCPSQPWDWISSKPIAHITGPEREKDCRGGAVGSGSNPTGGVRETVTE